jgi:cyclase
MDALAWAKEGEARGAGEIVVNAIDADGTRQGYDVEFTRLIADAVGLPVIASGGGGRPQHLYQVLTDGRADAALVASMLHFGEYTVGSIKDELGRCGLEIRRANGPG